MVEKVKKSKKTEEEQLKRTRCIAVYGKDGMLYNLSVASEGPIKKESIVNELFHGVNVNSFELTDEKDGRESVFMFWTGDGTGMPWDMNVFATEFFGHPVYSSIIVFVAENEMNDKECTWEWDEFSTAVRDLIHDTINKASGPAKSKIFGISSITMRLGNEKVTVKEGKNKKRLDDYWMRYYRGQYVTEFITTECHEEGDDAAYPVTLLEKPGLVTMLHIFTGDAEIWFTANQDSLRAMWKEIKDIDIDEEDPEKYKELYNKEVDKIKIKYSN